MGSWQLSFRHPETLGLEQCERLLAPFVEKVTTKLGPLQGDPREGCDRSVTMKGRGPNLRVELQATQSMRDARDPEPILHIVYVTVTAPYAAKLATWQAMSAAFGAVGCIDQTLVHSGTPMIDDADAARDTATAARLRLETGAALVLEARTNRSVGIRSPRTDVEPILAAYQLPERIATMSLTDCGLLALPAGFARFPALETLILSEDALDGSILRGVSRAKLTTLSLTGNKPWRLAKEDLAGFPALEILRCSGELEDLDPDIVTVCPRLVRVYIQDTPLARDETRVATLRARWPRMLWRYEDGVAAPPKAAPSLVDTARPQSAPDSPRLVEIRGMIEAGASRSRVTLAVGHTSDGDAIVAVVASSGAFPSLVELDLRGCSMTDGGVLGLATTATALDRLESIRLDGDDRDVVGVGDPALEALARSPRLPALRRVARTVTHHVYAAGARDDTEVIPVQRDDGRVVECVTGHQLWP